MAGLNQEQWTEVELLFERAVELPPEMRLDLLERECSCQEVRREVTSLLEHSGEGVPSVGAAIAVEAAALAQEVDPDERLIGARLGPYRVEAIAGRGGMGAVYRASRDDAEFRQQVAIKLVRTAAESPETLRRFRQERQILARLTHPNIARLLDGGSTPEGVPYLVMEFIEGEPITIWCERQSLGVEERLRLFLQVCEGVDFAHRDLVVHRDLKPANILVTKDGTPKLLDFGIAKLLDPDQKTAATLTGLLMMTPEYTSPEQVRGEPASTAADVYALGLVLYELLTGRKAQEVGALTPSAIVQAVCHTAPTAPALLKPQLSGDLDNIIRMAIRKEPERRYATAGDLARDIQRHLRSLPVMARPDTFAYRSAKFLRRNRIVTAAAVLVAIALVGGLALLYWLTPRVPRMLQVVQLTQTGRAELEDGVVTDGSRVFFTERLGGSWRLAQVPVQGGAPVPLQLTSPVFQQDILDISPDGASLLVGGGPGLGDDHPLWIVPVRGGSASRVGDATGTAGAWSRDGSTIVFARNGALFEVDRYGRGLRKLAEVPGQVYYMRSAPAPFANVLRFSLFSRPGPVVLWESGPHGSNPHPLFLKWRSGASWFEGEVSGIWMPGGRYFLFKSDRDGASSVFSRREERRLLSWSESPPVQIYSMPTRFGRLTPGREGDRVFFVGGHERREVVRYNPRLGQFLPFLFGAPARWVDFSKDGKWVAYTTVAEAALWRSRLDGSERLQLAPPSMHAGMPRWSPDGSQVAFSCGTQQRPGRLCVVPAAGGPVQEVAKGGGEPSWSADGKSLLFWCQPQAGVPRPGLYVIALASRKFTPVPGSNADGRTAWSPDSRYIAGNQTGSQIELFDFKTQKWSPLVNGVGLGLPMWSRDSRYVYYQDILGGAEQPVFRVRISSGKIERIVDSRQILQSNVTAYLLTGLAPGDTPIATLIRSNSDIYALRVDLPK